jgi:hypothetical protein
MNFRIRQLREHCENENECLEPLMW